MESLVCLGSIFSVEIGCLGFLYVEVRRSVSGQA